MGGTDRFSQRVRTMSRMPKVRERKAKKPSARHPSRMTGRSNCTAVVKLGRIVLAGATASDLGDGDNALRIRPPRFTYEIRGPVRQ